VADDRDHLGFKLPNDDPADYGFGANKERPAYFADGKPQGLGKYKSAATGVANIAGRSAAAMAMGYRIWKNNIKDESWPAISSVDDFYNLPKHILDECINVFGYKPIQITENHPDAPRWVLRSIFKSWFFDQSMRPSNKLSLINNHPTVYNLPLRSLYNTDSFKQEIINIGKFFNVKINLDNFSDQVHQQFVDMVPYKESTVKCEKIINSIDNHEHFQIALNVVEEGYVNYCIEQKFGITMPEETEQYFNDTGELSAYVRQKL
jgi:hypothetical protein